MAPQGFSHYRTNQNWAKPSCSYWKPLHCGSGWQDSVMGVFLWPGTELSACVSERLQARQFTNSPDNENKGCLPAIVAPQADIASAQFPFSLAHPVVKQRNSASLSHTLIRIQTHTLCVKSKLDVRSWLAEEQTRFESVWPGLTMVEAWI